jgi:hypothetical protein
MATKAERDARLDELQKAVEAWAEAETKRLTDQVALSKRMLKGRGAERLAAASVQAVSDLTVDEINSFLTG